MKQTKITRTKCFAYTRSRTGEIFCSALHNACCRGCNFYRTKADYLKNVKPLKYKRPEKV